MDKCVISKALSNKTVKRCAILAQNALETLPRPTEGAAALPRSPSWI